MNEVLALVRKDLLAEMAGGQFDDDDLPRAQFTLALLEQQPAAVDLAVLLPALILIVRGIAQHSPELAGKITRTLRHAVESIEQKYPELAAEELERAIGQLVTDLVAGRSTKH